VDVDLALAGSLGSSTLSGSVRLDDAGFDVPDLGVRVRELSLVARSRSLDVLEYDGQARIGDGAIELGGESRRTADGMKTRVSLKGDRLVVADIPEARVVVSPDLEISVDRERAVLGGTIVVPEALLKPVTIPEGAVAPSRDVVVAGENGEEGGVRLATAADVQLRLGDAVRFDGFGLTGFIRGDLRVTQEPGRLALGNGQLSVVDGDFSTFGVELPIDQGRLIFANTPVDDPGINVVARREFTDATVGARVTGTLKEPQLTFFSSPAMGQAEALNYLLTGGQSRGGATGATLVGGSFLLGEAGSRIGISDIGLTQTAGSENLSVYVGTYLNPRLYMQYITEMGEQANRVRFRYDLTRRLQAEVETGDVQSGSIFFTIER
jgi:translocation and assembly module TamB